MKSKNFIYPKSTFVVINQIEVISMFNKPNVRYRVSLSSIYGLTPYQVKTNYGSFYFIFAKTYIHALEIYKSLFHKLDEVSYIKVYNSDNIPIGSNTFIPIRYNDEETLKDFNLVYSYHGSLVQTISDFLVHRYPSCKVVFE